MKLQSETNIHKNEFKSPQQSTAFDTINNLRSEISDIDSKLDKNHLKQKTLLSIINNLRQSRIKNQNEQIPSFTAIDALHAQNIAKQLSLQFTTENQAGSRLSFKSQSVLYLLFINKNQEEFDDEDYCSKASSSSTNSTFIDESNLLQQQASTSNLSNPCIFNDLFDRIQQLEQCLTKPCHHCQQPYISANDLNTTATLHYNNNAQTDHPFSLNNTHQTTFTDSPNHFNQILLPDLTNSFKIFTPNIRQQALTSKDFLSQSNIHPKQPIIMQGHLNNQPVTLLNTSAAELITTLKNLRTERDSFNKSYKNTLEILYNRDEQLIEINSIIKEYYQQLQTIERLKNVEDILRNQNWNEMYEFISQIKSRSLLMSKLTNSKDLHMNENLKRFHHILNTSPPDNVSPAPEIVEKDSKPKSINKKRKKKELPK